MMEGGTFTFIVGPEKAPLEIHKALVADLSKPLEKLMTNGMQESVEGKATLEGVLVQTFTLFAEYAYNGVYHARVGHVHESKVIPAPGAAITYCRSCGCKLGDVHWHMYAGNGSCSEDFCHTLRGASSFHLHCEYCSEIRRLEKRKYLACLCQKDGLGVSTSPSAFYSRKYDVVGIKHEDIRRQLDSFDSSAATPMTASAHARLFMFAECYMIESLKQLCLHQLHRHLITPTVDEVNIQEIINLIKLTEEHTSTDEKSSAGAAVEGVGKGLRDLVITYTVSYAKRLAGHAPFKAMLAEAGDLVAEIICTIAMGAGT